MKKFLLFLLFVFVFLFELTFLNFADKGVIRVGVYGDLGASPICVTETLAALKIDAGIVPVIVKGVDIARGVLDNLDVIIFPGGSGSKEASSMGARSRKAVRDFVMKSGKGAVGICAGGYLFSSTPVYKWSLKLTSADVFDRAHYNRGRGLIEVKLTEKGKKIFPELKDRKTIFLQYYDGPVLIRSEKSSLSRYIEMGKYVTDIHLTGNSKSGITPDKTALLLNEVGRGKSFVVIGHPEATPGMRWMIPRMVRVVAGKKLIEYSTQVVRPDRYNKTILFDRERAKKEKRLFWKLVGDVKGDKIDALNELVKMRSRPVLRWAIGLLRDDFGEVRVYASDILAEAEYTPSIEDMETAFKTEENKKIKWRLKKNLNILKKIIHKKD